MKQVQYYNAFETYPRRALFYLNRARDFETVIIPESEASYLLEEGSLLRDRSLTTQALENLDPVWERDLLADCYRELTRIGPRRARGIAAEELFSLNRGALLQASVGLPVEIKLRYDNIRVREKTVYKILAKTGFIRAAADTSARFRLDININELPGGDYIVSGELSDTAGELNSLRHSVQVPSLSAADLRYFAGAFSKAVFRVE